jgi:DNA-binding response OmpR family regulator
MFNKHRLLLVDSSNSVRSILYNEIAKRMPSLDIIACATAKEALTAIKRFEFEIITTSIDLSDMDGYKLIEQVRKSGKNKDTAIFVVSGDTDTRIVGDDMDDTNAVTAYIDKAEGHQALVSFILNFLGEDTTVPIKVLYVDKSATSTAITTSIMEKNDVAYTHFKEAEDALDFLRQDFAENHRCTVDMLIVDIMLSSQMNGIDLIQNIRKELEFDYLALPALLLTIEPGEDDRTDFTGIFGSGTNDFMTKPINPTDLLNRIRTLVNIKRQNEALNH